MLVRASAIAVVLAAATSAHADYVVDYTFDAGGTNEQPLNGLAARATFSLDGFNLQVRLENISTGIPIGFEVSDSLLVSLAFDLPQDVIITEGVSAVIGSGSTGLGAWSGLVPGDSVAEEWAWTNAGAGDMLETYGQVLSTSMGFGSGDHTRFDGVLNGNVSGPFGGVATLDPILDIPGDQYAIGGAVTLVIELNEMLSEGQLESIALGGMVEFGSNAQYLTVPAPSALAVLLLGAGIGRRRRR